MPVNYELITKNILKYQEKKQYSQKHLAKLIEIKPNSLSAIIGNRAEPSFNVLLKIADALNINVDRLLDGNLEHTITKFSNKLEDEIKNNVLIATVEQKEKLIEILDEYINRVKK